MRYLFVLIGVLLIPQISSSQIYEVGLFAGGSNVIGDVGATNYISPNSVAFGAIAKWNRSPRHAFRFSAIFTELKGFDSKSDDPRRIERDYDFSTSALELSLGMEFTFVDFNLHESGLKVAPYMYTGLSTARHDNYYFEDDVYTSENTSSWAYGIPMVLGIKANISRHFILAAEIGVRYTFSDEIDGSVPDADFRKESRSFGNINSNDWYTFTGLTLTYTFGRRPCYCNF